MSTNQPTNQTTWSTIVLPALCWFAVVLMIAMVLTSFAAITDARRCHDRGGRIVLSGPLNTTSTCTYR